MKDCHIRVSKEFKSLIYKIRAKEMLINAKEISCQEVSSSLIKYIDWEKVWEKEYAKK